MNNEKHITIWENLFTVIYYALFAIAIVFFIYMLTVMCSPVTTFDYFFISTIGHYNIRNDYLKIVEKAMTVPDVYLQRVIHECTLRFFGVFACVEGLILCIACLINTKKLAHFFSIPINIFMKKYYSKLSNLNKGDRYLYILRSFYKDIKNEFSSTKSEIKYLTFFKNLANIVLSFYIASFLLVLISNYPISNNNFLPNYFMKTILVSFVYTVPIYIIWARNIFEYFVGKFAALLINVFFIVCYTTIFGYILIFQKHVIMIVLLCIGFLLILSLYIFLSLKRIQFQSKNVENNIAYYGFTFIIFLFFNILNKSNNILIFLLQNLFNLDFNKLGDLDIKMINNYFSQSHSPVRYKHFESYKYLLEIAEKKNDIFILAVSQIKEMIDVSSRHLEDCFNYFFYVPIVTAVCDEFINKKVHKAILNEEASEDKNT